MATKNKLVGNAFVITSDVPYKDLLLVAEYAPEKLVLKGGEDGKDEIFRVLVEGENGSLDDNGATFGCTEQGENKVATITMLIPKCENAKEYIADKYGEALTNLNKLVETIPAAVEEVKANRKAIIDSIETA